MCVNVCVCMCVCACVCQTQSYNTYIPQKINAKNAFGLHLIDYMMEMLRKMGEMTNFQVGGGTWKASGR